MKFEELDINPLILKEIKKQGFLEPTKIQVMCIPKIKRGCDVVGQSLTGSGKTAAFTIPLTENIQPGNGLQALVLTPTRELCVQVTDSFEMFAKALHIKTASIYGGVSMEPQYRALKKAEVAVATPGRLLDHIRRGSIRLDRVRFFVLDEVDKMFDMGFVADVETVIKHIPKKRQTLLFSATMSPRVHTLVKKHLLHPVFLKAETVVDKSRLMQVYYLVDQREKFSLLVHLLKNKTQGFSLIFCGTRRQVDALSKNLSSQDVKSLAIHGGLTQNRRMHALESLKKAHISVLVATDVAARGLDIPNVTHVYNYDVPKTSEEYVHRIGRTARAGRGGDAITLLTHRDFENFDRVLSDRTIQVKKEELPSFKKIPFRMHAERHDVRGPRPKRTFGAKKYPKRERWRDG